MDDFENLGAFVEKKCAIYPNVTLSMSSGRLSDIHHFDSDRVNYITFIMSNFLKPNYMLTHVKANKKN